MNKYIKQLGAASQSLLIAIVVGLTIVAVAALLIFGNKQATTAEADEHGEQGHTEEHGKSESGKSEHAESGHSEDGHGAEGHADESEEGVIEFTAKQVVEHGLKIASVTTGEVQQITSLPARLVANSDQQAHVSPMFSGRVEAVYTNLGQDIQKGQRLASIVSPDLVGQQSEVILAQSNLQLARQEYEREKQLWSQGVSAKQDYQRASNAYQQAQIALQVAQSRLSALGAAASSNGRYTLTAPMSGVISAKDIMVGEYVQLADQLFVIDELNQLWLEFVLPSQPNLSVRPQQEIEFVSLQTQQSYKARIQNINAQADVQTGRLQIRALVLSKANELRPNLMTNVELSSTGSAQALRIAKQAVQNIDGKTTVFVSRQHGDKVEFVPQVVELGRTSADQQWVEVSIGLTQGQSYVSQGSFLLKSELEKGEASHAH